MTLDPKVQQAADTALAGVTLPRGWSRSTPGPARSAPWSRSPTTASSALDGAYPPGSTFKVITSTALLADGSTGSTPRRARPSSPSTARSSRTSRANRRARSTSPARSRSRATTRSSGSPTSSPRTHCRRPPRSTASTCTTGCRCLRTAGPSRRRATTPSGRIGDRSGPHPGQPDADGVGGRGGRVGAMARTVDDDAARGQEPPHGERVSTRRSRPFAVSWRASCSRVAPRATPDSPDAFGKTGTAEFGHANPPETHAWFIGYENDLAFAVIVEGGGVGGRVAAPLAAKVRERPRRGVARASPCPRG